MFWAAKVGRMGGPNTDCSDSSSGEEDGEAEWKAAINSVAASSSAALLSSFVNGFSSASNNSRTPNTTQNDYDDDGRDHKRNILQLKHYQLKAQKLLDDMLEKTLVMVREPVDIPDNDPKIDEGGIHLFKHAPPGIVFDFVDELQRPRKRPRILPGKEIHEKSKKFRRRIQSAAVSAEDITAAARDALQKSLARLESKNAAAKAAAKREEQRVAALKKIRGERWLPSVAREMQGKFRS